ARRGPHVRRAAARAGSPGRARGSARALELRHAVASLGRTGPAAGAESRDAGKHPRATIGRSSVGERGARHHQDALPAGPGAHTRRGCGHPGAGPTGAVRAGTRRLTRPSPRQSPRRLQAISAWRGDVVLARPVACVPRSRRRLMLLARIRETELSLMYWDPAGCPLVGEDGPQHAILTE